MSRAGRKARATLALDGVTAEGRNQDRGAGAILAALREMVGTPASESAGLSLFAGLPSDPLGDLLSEFDQVVAEYGAPAARGAVELLARIAAAAVGELAERRGKDPEKVLLKIARQFGEVDDDDE
jgi:hypothetical protein